MKNLKAIGAAVLAVALTLSLVACSSDDATTSTSTDSTVAEDVVEEDVAEVGAAALGFGLIGNAGSGDAKATANTTVAAVLVDEAGAIVDVKIDVAQCYVYSENGVWSTPEEYFTKTELEYDYGMGSDVGEWFEQQAVFMAYIIGMTADEVAAIGMDDSTYPTDEDLLAGCTIKIGDYVGAVLLAMESATDYVCTVEDTLSLAMSTPVSTGTDVSTDEAGAPVDGKISLTTTVGAIVVGTDGVVADVYIDATQPSFTNTAEDAITGAGEVLSKQQKEYDYGMLAVSEVGEWFEQQAVFMAYVVGMDASEIANIEYDEDTVAVDEDLLAGCTIKISSYVDILVKAIG